MCIDVRTPNNKGSRSFMVPLYMSLFSAWCVAKDKIANIPCSLSSWSETTIDQIVGLSSHKSRCAEYGSEGSADFIEMTYKFQSCLHIVRFRATVPTYLELDCDRICRKLCFVPYIPTVLRTGIWRHLVLIAAAAAIYRLPTLNLPSYAWDHCWCISIL